jgi:hypothetical protein
MLESGGGNLTGTVTNATVSSNAGNGVFADASGTAALAGVTVGGNASGLIGGIATITPEPSKASDALIHNESKPQLFGR